MFSAEAGQRTPRQNYLLAGYLATIAGFVNSGAFILIGSFTSHTTGNVGRFADELALGNSASAFAALALISLFFAGAFTASMIIEANLLRRLPYTYALLLGIEAGLLLLFLGARHVFTARHTWDVSAGVLCFAMGLQNSMVTRISGAVVRTTHLTGVITDLGIESARWFRYWRTIVAERTHLRLSFGQVRGERPATGKVYLLLTIIGAFFGGALAGGFGVLWLGRGAMLVPIGLLLGGMIYAVTTAIITPADRG